MGPRPTRKRSVLSLHFEATLLLHCENGAGLTAPYKIAPQSDVGDSNNEDNQSKKVAQINKVSTGRRTCISNQDGELWSKMELFFWSPKIVERPVLLLSIAIPSE